MSTNWQSWMGYVSLYAQLLDSEAPRFLRGALGGCSFWCLTNSGPCAANGGSLSPLPSLSFWSAFPLVSCSLVQHVHFFMRSGTQCLLCPWYLSPTFRLRSSVMFSWHPLIKPMLSSSVTFNLVQLALRFLGICSLLYWSHSSCGGSRHHVWWSLSQASHTFTQY